MKKIYSLDDAIVMSKEINGHDIEVLIHLDDLVCDLQCDSCKEHFHLGITEEERANYLNVVNNIETSAQSHADGGTGWQPGLSFQQYGLDEVEQI